MRGVTIKWDDAGWADLWGYQSIQALVTDAGTDIATEATSTAIIPGAVYKSDVIAANVGHKTTRPAVVVRPDTMQAYRDERLNKSLEKAIGRGGGGDGDHLVDAWGTPGGNCYHERGCYTIKDRPAVYQLTATEVQKRDKCKACHPDIIPFGEPHRRS